MYTYKTQNKNLRVSINSDYDFEGKTVWTYDTWNNDDFFAGESGVEIKGGFFYTKSEAKAAAADYCGALKPFSADSILDGWDEFKAHLQAGPDCQCRCCKAMGF